MMQKGESPFQVGRENPQQQQQRQLRTSWVQTQGVNTQYIPQVAWACPPQFTMDPTWEVNTGSESQEIHSQRQRISTIPEVVYLSDRDIPDNPRVSPDAYDFMDDDSKVPLIPIDDDDSQTSSEAIPTTPVAPSADATQPSAHRDEVTRTAIALYALAKSKEPGSLIDLPLLLHLLRNPSLLAKLLRAYGLSAQGPSVPLPIPSPMTRIRPTGLQLGPVPTPLSVTEPEKSPNVPLDAWAPSVPFAHSRSEDVKQVIDQICGVSKSQSGRSTPLEAGQASSSSVSRGKGVVVEDTDYYRRLILQHGMPQLSPSPQQRPTKEVVCVYFNRPGGCRQGANCRFKHTAVNHNAKRMKLEGESFGKHT